jgi:exodeoxyribonuclease VII small subunit
LEKKPTESNFEQKLDQLDGLVKKMEEGGMQLEELMASYERGIELAQGLNRELDLAQAKLLKLKGSLLEVSGDGNAL